MDKETEQTIVHALITKDDFQSLSLPRPLPLPLSLSVIFLSWLFFLLSLETFSVDERKHKLNIKTPRSPLNTCHLSFVQIMVRVTIETAPATPPSSPVLVSLSLLVRQRETGRLKQTVREKTTVNYEDGAMIKNEPFKNPICHGGVRWEMSEGQSMYCGSLWTLTNIQQADERDESLLGCLVHSLIMMDEYYFSVMRLWALFIVYFWMSLCFTF